ncbi:unnamed protein product [Ectocarpus sp. 12 AP-2014]
MDPQQMNGGRFLLLVTGSSRGFGRCVAEEFVRQVAPANPVDLILVARSETGLESATDSVNEIAASIGAPGGVVVRKEPLDLGDLDHLEANLEGVFSRIDPTRYSRAVLVNNAGSLGHIGVASELPSLAAFRSEMDFNITSALWLSSRFTAVFGAKRPNLSSGNSVEGTLGECGADVDKNGATTVSTASADTVHDVSNNIVVNISSLAALQPFETWGGYSSGKAARDMFHRRDSVLATEQASIGGLKVLNYAPGPMNTDMAREIRSAEQFEEDLQSGKLVDARVSAEKCVRLALHGTFASGSHVDYFDED